MLPKYAIEAARREFPCICLDDYKERDRVDPDCRHDDFEHALDALVEMLYPPRCCASCDDMWVERVSKLEGSPYPFQRIMHICTHCGNKRCPRATDHRAACQET